MSACSDDLAFDSSSLFDESDLEVRPSLIPDAGLGLFTKVHIPKYTTFCEYTGTELTLRETMQLRDKTYLMGGFGINCHIDAREHPDVMARYINDGLRKERQNARFVKHPELKKASVVSTRDIFPGEEIYASYGELYWRFRPCPDDSTGSIEWQSNEIPVMIH